MKTENINRTVALIVAFVMTAVFALVEPKSTPTVNILICGILYYAVIRFELSRD